MKLSEIGVSVECFTADFSQCYSRIVKIWLLAGRILVINPKIFRDFLGISEFPKTRNLKLLGDLRGNSYSHLLMIII